MKKRTMQKVLTAALCAMGLGIGTTAMAAQYPDVPEGAWFYDSVQYVSDKGIMTGYADNTFGATNNITRAEFATILYRCSGAPDVSFEKQYPDVAEGVFYSEAVTWAKSTGVITGYADGYFGPSDKITREQMATILYRYEGAPEVDLKFIEYYPDSGSVSAFAKNGVAWTISTSIITGDQGRIKPSDNALRAHSATILKRYLEGDWVEPPAPADKSTIENTDSKYTIQADVKLTGGGTGYHAKLVACTPTSAVSFGIQFDQWAETPYTGKTAFLIENIASNNSGGQAYKRTGLSELDTTYRLMLSVQEDGRCDVYVDGVLAGSVINSELANQTLALRVEGSGRKNNDHVNAEFYNIKLKNNSSYDASKHWGTHEFQTNEGINCDRGDFPAKILIKGDVVGLSPEQDWDNAYGIVSGITQFVD